MNFLPFALPEIGEEEIAEVADALRSGWITSGPKTIQFEKDFASFLGHNVEAVALNSATAGLHLGLEALGIGPGDEVITTTHTFTATAQVICHAGASPVIVDIDPETLCIDVRAVEDAITPRTRAVIPVHFGGRAAEMGALLDVARKHGLKVLEDAAHALPATSGGSLVGTLDSDATVFSFYANKTMTTGEGGMLVTRNPALAERVRTMRLHGISRDAFDRYNSAKANWQYEIVAPGHKCNLTDVAAAIGIHQLRKVDAFQKQRAQIAAWYDRALADLPLTLAPQALPGDTHAWHLYVVRLQSDGRPGRDKVLDGLFQAGIGCSVHYIPLHRHRYWQEVHGLRAEMFPHSDHAYERSISLPIYPRMRRADVDRVAAALRALV